MARKWTWGAEEQPTKARIEQSIAGFCIDELDNSKLGIVESPSGTTFGISITVKLVPLKD